MKIGVWNYYDRLNKNNFLFNRSDSLIGDDLLKPFNKLYLFGKKKNIEFNTLCSCDIDEQDAFIFIDYPNLNNKHAKKALSSTKPKFLIIFESELIRPDNWSLDNHVKFEKVFTWCDLLINGDLYEKINFSFDIPKKVYKGSKDKLCTVIAGNKKVNHPLELYSKRVEAIRWFEKNHPDDFDLYGVGWNEFRFSGPKFIRVLNRIKPLTRLLAPNFPSYKGKVAQKKNVLEKYKFAICYENARDIPGYITEKIFDCFFAGCVPIYWGANNVEQHIPKECFIDKRAFATYDQLYDYMINMSDEEYLERLNAIEAFLSSDKAKPFSIDYFVNTILTNLTSDMKPK